MPQALSFYKCSNGKNYDLFLPTHKNIFLNYISNSLILQICDDQYRILNVNAKFGGANHDSFIWENSDINRYMQSLHQNGEIVWLLGKQSTINIV